MQEKRKRYLIFYKDENDISLKTYSNLFEVKEGLVTFETSHNKITIPSARILKIKDFGGGQ